MNKKCSRLVAEAFIEPIEACFRKPNEDPKAVAEFYYQLSEALKGFDGETLRCAAIQFVRKRKDPFLPTVAECVSACLAACRWDEIEMVAAFERARLDDETVRCRR